MNKKFFSGDSVRQALLQAARHFQVEPEEVAYREVDRRHGFLRGRRRAVIEVDLDNPVRLAPVESAEDRQEVRDANGPAAREEATAAGGPGPRPIEELPTAELPRRELTRLAAPDNAAEETATAGPESETAELPVSGPSPRADRDSVPEEAPAPSPERSAPVAEGVEKATREALERIFELGRLDLEVEEITMGEERLQIELRGEDEEILLEDRGRLLLAIQHLLPRMLRGLTGKSTPCLVDCDDFHEIRTEQLRDLAQRVASEVRNHRRSRTLEPMSPDERRIVHLTLADDPAVETVSQGNGLFKRVQIRPQRLEPRDFDPFGKDSE